MTLALPEKVVYRSSGSFSARVHLNLIADSLVFTKCPGSNFAFFQENADSLCFVGLITKDPCGII